MIYEVDYEIRTMNGTPMEPERPESLQCDSGLKRVKSLTRCTWDPSMMVGPRCEVRDDLCLTCGGGPDECTCESEREKEVAFKAAYYSDPRRQEVFGD
jgi:hypothetical protein